MKMVRDLSGKFSDRPFFSEGEIDRIMEEMLQAAGNPRLPGLPAVDMDMVMLNLDLEARYVSLPRGVLGVTQFTVGGNPEISISAELEENACDDSNALHRLRSTQAHEVGHATLHAPLYVQVSSSVSAVVGKLPCEGSQQVRTGRYSGEWWEYQANAAMAALIMPAPSFREESSSWCQENRVKDLSRVRSGSKYEAFVEWMAERFCVSKEATRIRAKVLGLRQE